jgi:O-antigen ligase
LKGNQRLRVGLGGFFCVAGLVVLTPNLAESLATILGTASEQASTDTSVGARRDDYGPALELVRERPLLGRGYGTFNPDLNFFLDNQVLKILIEAGVVGLVAMLGLIVTAASACLRFRQRARSPGDRALAWAVFTSLTAITVSFVFYDALYFSMTAGAYFFLLGVSGALERFTPASPTREEIDARGSLGSGAPLVGDP